MLLYNEAGYLNDKNNDFIQLARLIRNKIGQLSVESIIEFLENSKKFLLRYRNL